MNTQIIHRIRLMELYFDTVQAALQYDECITDNPHVRHMVKVLSNYMENGLWLSDYEYDEQGNLPKDLKRGVLSQDALYELLTEHFSNERRE